MVPNLRKGTEAHLRGGRRGRSGRAARIVSLPLCRCATFALVAGLFASSAHAQVAIHPLTTTPGAWERFAIRVAHQADAPVVAVRVAVPGAVTILGVEPAAGWSVHRSEAAETGPQTVEWSGGTVAKGEYREFALLGRVIGDARRQELVFPVELAHADGSDIAWSGQPGAPRPAPRVRIVGTTQVSGWGALAGAGLAFGVALLALIVAMTRRAT